MVCRGHSVSHSRPNADRGEIHPSHPPTVFLSTLDSRHFYVYIYIYLYLNIFVAHKPSPPLFPSRVSGLFAKANPPYSPLFSFFPGHGRGPGQEDLRLHRGGGAAQDLPHPGGGGRHRQGDRKTGDQLFSSGSFIFFFSSSFPFVPFFSVGRAVFGRASLFFFLSSGGCVFFWGRRKGICLCEFGTALNVRLRFAWFSEAIMFCFVLVEFPLKIFASCISSSALSLFPKEPNTKWLLGPCLCLPSLFCAV